MLLIEQRMGEDVRIEDIARAFDLSLHHFHRLFLAETGETPAAYLRRIRLEAAALQLQRSSQPAGSIGQARGYNSQAAFTRAFQSQFGVPPLQYRREPPDPIAPPGPESDGTGKIVVGDVTSFRVLAMRFVGNVWKLPEYWDVFLNALPGWCVADDALYLGQLHDTPRVTQSTQTRYDCCVTVAPDCDPSPEALAGTDLIVTQTRPGPYAGLVHAGPPRSIPQTYDVLCNQWLPQSGYHATDDPVVELHELPPNRQNPEHRVFTILLPIE